MSEVGKGLAWEEGGQEATSSPGPHPPSRGAADKTVSGGLPFELSPMVARHFGHRPGIDHGI